MDSKYNALVNWPLGQIAILLCAGLSVSVKSIDAQFAPDAIQDKADAPCALSDLRDREHVGPNISITEVSFTGSVQLPHSDQAQIAQSVREKSHGASFDEVVEEGLERARAGWQNRGYFGVRLVGDAKILTSSPVTQDLALHIQVLDEGVRYNLAHITFTNNKAIQNLRVLRGLFPIKDGDVFSREKIATGLENLRRAYGQLGYIDFTATPNTIVDNRKRFITVETDIDEGVQFYLTRVEVLGMDEASRQEILKDAPVGQIYNERLLNLFLKKHAPTFKFSSTDPLQIARRVNEKTGTMEVSLDARPCPVD